MWLKRLFCAWTSQLLFSMLGRVSARNGLFILKEKEGTAIQNYSVIYYTRKEEEMDSLDILTRRPLCHLLSSSSKARPQNWAVHSPQMLGSTLCCSQEVFACILQAMRRWNISAPFYQTGTSLTSHSWPRDFACTEHLYVTLEREERSQTFLHNYSPSSLPCSDSGQAKHVAF